MNETVPLFPAITAALNNRPMVARVLFLLFMLVCVSLASLHIVRFASITTDENKYVNSPHGVKIIGILPGGASDRAGLLVDDIIVAVNDQPVHTTDEAMVFIIQGSKGKSLFYTIERNGSRFVTEVVLADFGLPLVTVIFVLVSVLFFVSAGVVFLRRPERADARRFGWAMLVAGTYLPLSVYYPPSYYNIDVVSRIQIPLSLVFWGATLITLYYLSHHYPVRRFQAAWPRWLFGLLIGLVIVLPSAAFITKLVPYSIVSGLAITVVIIAIMEYVIRFRLKLQPNPEYRRTVGYLRIAGLITLGCYVLAIVIDQNSVLHLFLLSLCAVPVLLFYPVVKYRLFDLYVVIRRTSLYTASRAGLHLASLIVLGGMIVLLSRQHINVPVPRMTGTSLELLPLHSFPATEQQNIEKRFLILAAILLGGLLWFGWRQGKRMLDTHFHRGAYDYRRALQEFSRLSVRYSDLETLSSTIVIDLIQLMRLHGASFAVRDAEALRIVSSQQIVVTRRLESALHIDSSWLQQFLKEPAAAAVKNLSDRDLFAETGITFISPIILDGVIAGCLFLGEKLSETNFTTEDVELLNNLSINIADALRTIHFYEDAKEQERLKRELEIARRIQRSALPSTIPEFPGIEVAAISQPAYEVGGDFYDFLARHDSVTFLIGDVSGKGTSAALYLARIQGILRTIESYQPDLWELFVRLNTQIFEHIERHVYLTLAALRVDFLSNKIDFLRAGHLPLIRYATDAAAIVYHKPGGVGIGLDQAMFGEYLQPETIITHHGDVCVLVSDGISEAVNAEGEQFEVERIGAVLAQHVAGNASMILEAVLAEVQVFTGGASLHDDMTIVVVKLL